MNDKYPHLIEATGIMDTERTYLKGPGVRDTDLTDEEKVMLELSRQYIEKRNAEENERLLKLARKDFEKLRDIPNMPDKAIDILRVWTTREEDEWDYDIDE